MRLRILAKEVPGHLKTIQQSNSHGTVGQSGLTDAGFLRSNQ